MKSSSRVTNRTWTRLRDVKHGQDRLRHQWRWQALHQVDVFGALGVDGHRRLGPEDLERRSRQNGRNLGLDFSLKLLHVGLQVRGLVLSSVKP